MGFAVGEVVGPYQITEYIGLGGMATVYKAHQLTLDRDVAIKVIHPALKQDQSFLMRLNREASIVAKLNHPNIVTVFDYGEHQGLPYIVMRYINGKTLKAILQEQKFPIERAIEIARCIGAALSYAHAHDVLHRDVKSSNVMIDDEGNVFLTDFGLARLTNSGDSTLSRDMLVGSPQYISPEQAKSEPVDRRADIYSFGIVLYEMLTGRVPFQGDTPYATIMLQINEPLPPARELNPAIPLAVLQVLEKALAKDPAHRYANINEMMGALENAVRGPQTAEDDTAPIVPHPFEDKSNQKPLAAVPANTTPAQSAPAPATPAPVTRAAPDTRFPLSRTWLIATGVLLLVALIGVCGLFLRTFSPAARSVAVNSPASTISATRAVLVSPTTIPSPVIAKTDPPPVVESPTPTPARAVTAIPPSGDIPRGKIVYSIAKGELPEQHSVWVANVNGGDARLVAEIAMWATFSPDGKQIAFFRMKDSGIYMANSDGGNVRKVMAFSDACCIQWSPDGKRLAFFRGDMKKFGGWIYTSNLDGSGLDQIAIGFNPAWSPDGTKLAYTSCQSSECGVFVIDLKTRSFRMLTKDNGSNPQWSPRGDKIVYQASEAAATNVFVVNADGSGRKQLTFGRGNDGQPTWSRDGNFIFWRSDQNGAGWAIFWMRPDGSNHRLIIGNVPAPTAWGRESLSTAP